MRNAIIATQDDLRSIEKEGIESWVHFDHVHDALSDVALRYGERPALTALSSANDTAPRCWTYGQLLADICRTANLFNALADEAVPCVALLLPPLPEAWLALWGAESAGHACPINPALSDDHLVALLNAAGANIIVTLAPGHEASDIGSRVQKLRNRCPKVSTVLGVGGSAAAVLDFEAERKRYDDTTLNFKIPASDDGIAALFHTGGTTGLPKLAQHTHSNQLHAAWGAARLYDANERDVILNGFPLFHVAGAIVYGLSMLLSGAEVVLLPPNGWRDPSMITDGWSAIRSHQVTLLATVPTVMSTLLTAPRLEGDSATLRLTLTGGSPLPTELAIRFEQEIKVPVRNILGMTECAGIIAIEPAGSARTPGSCGLPLPFTEIGVGADGVLRLRGPSVGPGYTDPASNVGSFEDGWLITGDIGHIDDAGRVFVTGRAKDVIIRGAHNIDPCTIEEALMQHPEVLMAAAVGEPDEHAGELPVAFIMVQPNAVLDEHELLAFAAERVPERAAAPKRITQLDALPLTPVGKIYKPTLRRLAAERVVRERLQQAGLNERVTVYGQDLGGRLELCFEIIEGSEPIEAAPIEPDLRTIMAGFALTWKIK